MWMSSGAAGDASGLDARPRQEGRQDPTDSALFVDADRESVTISAFVLEPVIETVDRSLSGVVLRGPDP